MPNFTQDWMRIQDASARRGDAPETIEGLRQQYFATRIAPEIIKRGGDDQTLQLAAQRFDSETKGKFSASQSILTPEEQELARQDKQGTAGLNAAGDILKSFAGRVANSSADIASGLGSLIPYGGKERDSWSQIPANIIRGGAQRLMDETSQTTKDAYESNAGKAADFVLGSVPYVATMGISKVPAIAGLGTVGKLATGATVGFAGGYGSTAEQARQSLDRIPDEDLKRSILDQAAVDQKAPAVQAYIDANGDLRKTRDLLANHAGNVGGSVMAAVSPLIGMLGGTAGKVLANRAVGKLVEEGVSEPIARRMVAKSIADEAAKQTIGGVAKRVGTDMLMQGTGMGAAMAGGQYAATGAVADAMGRDRTDEEKAQIAHAGIEGFVGGALAAPFFTAMHKVDSAREQLDADTSAAKKAASEIKAQQNEMLAIARQRSEAQAAGDVNGIASADQSFQQAQQVIAANKEKLRQLNADDEGNLLGREGQQTLIQQAKSLADVAKNAFTRSKADAVDQTNTAIQTGIADQAAAIDRARRLEQQYNDTGEIQQPAQNSPRVADTAYGRKQAQGGEAKTPHFDAAAGALSDAGGDLNRAINILRRKSPDLSPNQAAEEVVRAHRIIRNQQNNQEGAEVPQQPEPVSRPIDPERAKRGLIDLAEQGDLQGLRQSAADLANGDENAYNALMDSAFTGAKLRKDAAAKAASDAQKAQATDAAMVEKAKQHIAKSGGDLVDAAMRMRAANKNLTPAQASEYVTRAHMDLNRPAMEQANAQEAAAAARPVNGIAGINEQQTGNIIDGTATPIDYGPDVRPSVSTQAAIDRSPARASLPAPTAQDRLPSPDTAGTPSIKPDTVIQVGPDGKAMPRTARTIQEEARQRRDTTVPSGLNVKVERPARPQQKAATEPMPATIQEAAKVVGGDEQTNQQKGVTVSGKGVTVSKESGMEVEFGGKRYPVDSLADASAKWKEYVGRNNLGVSDVGNGVPVYSGGKQIARVSYNGRLWDMQGKEISPDAPQAAQPKTIQQAASEIKPEVNASAAGTTASAAGKPTTQPKKAATKPVVDPERDNLLVAIAKLGGIDRAQAKAQGGFDPAEMNRRAGGLLPIFRKTGGQNLDRMAEMLHERGYPVSENGSYTVNALLDALDHAMRGGDVGTPMYHERKAQAEYEARQQEQDIPFDEPGTNWVDAASDSWMTEAVNNEIKPDAVAASELRSIEDEQRKPSASGASGQEADTGTKADGGPARAGEAVAGREGGQSEGQSVSGQGSGGQAGELTLESYTDADLAKRAEAIRQQQEAEKRKAESERLKAQADRELKDFRLSGSTAPADVAMAGGQKDLFAPKTRGEREAEKAKREEPQNASAKSTQPRAMTEEGRAVDGKPIMPGDTFKTSSGRTTTPYPKQKGEKYASQWLIDNATAEAEARGDDFNAPIFRRTTLLKGGSLTGADRDSMLMYLFGEQPKVIPSILKPLSPENPKSIQDHAKGLGGQKKSEPDFSHLNALENRLHNEKMRLKSAKTEAERKAREVTVAGIEREIEGERKFLGIESRKTADVGDDELLVQLGAEQSAKPSVREMTEDGRAKDATQEKIDELSQLAGAPVSFVKERYNSWVIEDGKEAAELFLNKEILRYKLEKARKETPANKKFDSLIATAADSPAKLREADIERVLDNAGSRAEIVRLRDYLIAIRPDKADFIADSAKDIGGDKGFDMSSVSPKGASAKSIQDHAKSLESQKKSEPEVAAEKDKHQEQDTFEAFAQRLGQGKVTLDEFKRRFDDLTANKDAVMAELSAKTKDQLLSGMGPMKYARYRNDKKDAIVRAAYSDMLTEFTLHKSLTYGMDGPEPAVRRMVANMTEADLAEYASRVAERRKKIDEARKNYANALENPQSLEDYRAYIRAKREGGMTYREAFLSLNPEQREKYDALEAEATKSRREERQRAEKTRIDAAQQKTGASIVETKHTQKGHDLFVVKLDDRVDRDSYNTLNAAAKRLGGYYSSYRAGGAVPGFQFTERTNAEAFSKLVQGDTTQAKEAISEKRDAFEDNKAQSAADRLDEMAQRLEETADAALNAERKTNTARRARFADAAMREAYAQQAMAKTMRNLSKSIRNGSAKFLGMVRQKVQIETLNRLVASAHENYLKDKYKDNWYSKREEPVTKASADHADFPTFTAWKSDLATLGRQLMQIPGAKRIGEALAKTADDVTEDYLAFARGNIPKVSPFHLKDGSRAVFSSKEAAENAIYKSGLSDRAIVLPVKRGENRIILSPKAAADLGVWNAEDKRITLKPDFADELVSKMTEYPKQVTQLHGLLSAKERIDRLKGMGIETPTELRAALREYIGLKEEAKRDKIKEMELSMVGRQNDGLDFFPTPEATVDRMIEEADIKPGMSVLEPEAGMGHIADRLREAGHEPEVMEISPSRRELLLAKGYRFPAEGEGDFTKVMPRTFHTFGDTFKAPDGTVGIMRGQGGMGSDRVRLDDEQGNTLGYYNRDELTPVGHRGTASGYDRIIMNPPFSNRQDAAHVMHAYDHLADGGRLVAIVGEGVFNGSDAKAVKFREWLSEHGARIEKLDAETFNDPSLPVTTQANARMVVIDKKTAPDIGKGDVKFSTADGGPGLTTDRARQLIDTDPVLSKASKFIDIKNSTDEIPSGADIIGGAQSPEGYYHNGKVTLFADNIAAFHNQSAEDRLKWVAFHELTHRGVAKLAESREYLDALDRAGQNPFIKNLATKIMEARKGSPYEVTRSIATEEALAEVSAALQTGDVSHLKGRYGLNFPESIRTAAKTAMQRFFEVVKRIFNRLTGRGLTDQQVGELLGRTMKAGFEQGESAGEATSGPAAMRYSVIGDVKDRISEEAKAMLASDSQLSLLNRTLGTKLNIALRIPAYKAVHDKVRAFLNHTNVEAFEAVNKAPELLARNEDASDYKRELKRLDPRFWSKDQAVKVEERNILAVAKIIYENTLRADAENKKVFTDAELRAKGLNDYQIRVYRTFMDAVNVSLDNFAKANITRLMMQAGVIDGDAAVRLHNKELPLNEHLANLREQAGQMAERLQDNINSGDDSAKTARELDVVKAAIDRSNDIADKANRLKAEGYAPAMRFGEHTVTAYDESGRVAYFEGFDSKTAAIRAERAFKEENPKWRVVRGTMSQEKFKQFQGLTPETVALFAKEAGYENDPAYQEYLKLAINNSSPLKRMIHRKGIAGYSQDLPRVLSSFVMSNARGSSRAILSGQMQDALSALKQAHPHDGKLYDDAAKLVDYVVNPKEEAQFLKNMLFHFYLAGSFGFGLVNLLQPLHMTSAQIARYNGGKAGEAVKTVAGSYKRAVQAMRTGKPPQEYAEAFKRAQREGYLDPANTYALQGIERGRSGYAHTWLGAASHALSSIARITETINRTSTFIAAMDFAKATGEANLRKAGFKDAYDFATRAIDETQGVYDKSNRPNAARGAIGSLLMAYKMYPINFIEFGARMAKEGAKGNPAGYVGLAMLLGVLAVTSGVTGLPLAQDVIDALEGIFAGFGHPFNADRFMREHMKPEAADVLMHGIGAVPGAPLDFASRMSMGSQIPGLPQLINPTLSDDESRRAGQQLGGAAENLLLNFYDAYKLAFGQGKYGEAVVQASPKWAKSVAKSFEMATKGEYTDSKGRKVRDVTALDAIVKALDIQPASISRQQRIRGIEMQDLSIQKNKEKYFADRMFDAAMSNDSTAMLQAQADLEKWNRDNPLYQVNIDYQRQVGRRVIEARKGPAQRLKTPKEMRWIQGEAIDASQ